ncbi:MAG: type II toxin-antitoxin system VapC family toxin [Kofleriaceae bacterium]
MSGFLVDADVLSEPQRARPTANVLDWLREHEEQLYTSAIVVGELAWGIERLADGNKRRALARWLDQEVLPTMEGRILSFDTRVGLEWGKLQGRLEAAGRRMPWRDSAVAATARRHGLTLVTRNTKDYQSAALELVNPFSTPA